ncbi:unnamed protein product [Camellia sinensis]
MKYLLFYPLLYIITHTGNPTSFSPSAVARRSDRETVLTSCRSIPDCRFLSPASNISNKGFDTTRDLIEAYVALQHIVSSMNYTCGVYLVILHAALERFDQGRREISRNPNLFKQQIDHLNRLVRNNDKDCHEQLRMNRHTFMRLCALIRTKGMSDSKHVVLEEKVAMFLSVLGHHHKNRTVKFNFMRSGETVSKYFNEVLKAVLQLQVVLLKTPEPIIVGCADDRWRWFQNCLGALDGTYVRVLPPAIDKPRYRSRKGEIATIMLGVCSQDMQFIYVLPGWEGSASDSRVLRDAISRPNGLRVPTGCYYLVDAGYTNGEGFLAPYRGQRYHLSTWREGGAPSNPQEFFNMKHSAAHNIIERCMDDSTATSSCGRKGKECDVLIRAIRDLFSEKWKADNGQFRAGFYSELEKLIILAFPGTDLRASPHIESKIKF